jgi:argininosuccinate lyase
MKTEKLWGKRFAKKTSALAQVFTSGRDVRGLKPADERLIPYDLWGSRAHVRMLAKQKILPRKEARILIRGLMEIAKLWEKGNFHLDPSKEDVHSNIESWLIQKFGLEVGGRIHTARSRNDQITLDMRLYLRDCALDFASELRSLINVLTTLAQKHREIILPGYTHHQPAQLTNLSHIWLSYAEGFCRDSQRFQGWFNRFNQNPLGSMTGYSTSFPIDRTETSKLLGFDGPCQNSLDPIQNRWEPESEMAFAIAIMMNHISSLAQTLILFSTGEFGILRLDDAYCSGSSMMPQKRNPDTLEVIKAKSALAQGHLMTLLAIGRSLFLGYNRDTQWTKYTILDLIDECLPAPRVISEIVVSLQMNSQKIETLCQKGFIAAPDLAEQLVQESGLPFRQVKEVMERSVKYSEAEGKEHVSYTALKQAMKDEGVNLRVSEKSLALAGEPKWIVSRRKAIGGTSPQAIQRNIQTLNRTMQNLDRWLEQKSKQLSSAKTHLIQMEKKL